MNLFVYKFTQSFGYYLHNNQKTQANVPVEKYPVDDINKEGFTTVIKKRKTFCPNLEKHDTPYLPY